MSMEPPYAPPPHGQQPPPGHQPPPYGQRPSPYGQQPQPQPAGRQPSGQWPPAGGQWQEPPRKTSRLGPVLAIVGAVMILAGIVLGVAVGRGVTGIVPGPGDITRVAGETVVQIDGGQVLFLYAPAGMMPTCDITGPTDQAPDIDLGGVSYTFPLENRSYEALARIGGPDEPAGEYTVDCQQQGLIIAPPIDVGGIVGSVGGLLGATALVGLGFVLLVVGVVVWLMARRTRA